MFISTYHKPSRSSSRMITVKFVINNFGSSSYHNGRINKAYLSKLFFSNPEKLKIITGAKQIKLALKVDPTLIGGFTVEIGSKLIDTSIKGQLKQISTLLGA